MSARRWDEGSIDPLGLAPVRPEGLVTITGDRRPVARFCAGCGGELEAGVVIRGYFVYCSYECALRTEGGDRKARP